MSNLSELLKQQAELEKAIADTRAKERASAIAQVRDLMSTHGLSLSDLSPKAGKTAQKGVKIEAKYRNPATGDTWSGRGLMPKWLKAAVAAGKKPQEFAVSASGAGA
jgi:DNA-binding protein H-NS